jgi:hypothetical protein
MEHSTTELSESTWNPQSQQQLGAALIGLGDTAIDAARSRLTAGAGWAETVAQFGAQTGKVLEKAVGAASATLLAAQADLAATNEAEKKLISTARTVSDAQHKFIQLKSTAAEKKSAAGEDYIGAEVLDVAAPVLKSTARLVEVVRQQTQLILRRDGNIPNQAALVNTTDSFFKGIEKVLAGIDAAVAQAKDAPEKLLAAANSTNEAVTKFLEQAQQKAGSPELNQVMGKVAGTVKNGVGQIQSFAEIAAQAQQAKAGGKAPAGSSRQPRDLSSLRDLLKAEAKVVQARKALELAEIRAKKIKEGSA